MVLPEGEMQCDDEPCDADTHYITICNIKNGETLCYSLALIKGRVLTRHQAGACRRSETKIQLRQYVSNDTKPIVSEWPVLNSAFKCLINLSIGNNHILLEYCGTKTEFLVIHHPRKTTFHVLPVYIICKGHDGRFQAPASEDNTVQSACNRIAIGARLIQCLFAEKLEEAGFEKKTFQLEHDLNPSSSECVVFQSQLTVEDARKMQPCELWEYFGRELMLSSLGKDDRKFLAFLSCTRYHLKDPDNKPKTHEDIIAVTEGYVALGGGGLAVFGSACLHTWAASLDEVALRFLNPSKVDTRHFMDDSCYRGTYGACYATTLGSVCHELGHTFDLGHSSEGIMGRGFDNIDMVFTLHHQNDNNNKIFGNGNRNVISPICKELPQHSIVCFTKVLNVSYTVSAPIKRVRGTSQSESDALMKGGTSADISAMHTTVSNLAVNEENHNAIALDNLRKECQSPKPNAILNSNGDCTYWSKSCATLLNYHRWFNNETGKSVGTLTFDTARNAVLSSVGVRVVEVRDDLGLILASWEFLNSQGKDLFLLPVEAQMESAHVLVAEDSAGSILKHVLHQSG